MMRVVRFFGLVFGLVRPVLRLLGLWVGSIVKVPQVSDTNWSD